MKNPDQLWLDLVNRYAEQSKCHSRQVGAILVDAKNHCFGQGYNSAPYGSVTDTCNRCYGEQTCGSGQSLDQALCSHAEANAIGNAARSGRSTDGATLYCTTFPCAECAKLIVSAGIVQVVYRDPYNSPITAQIFNNANVKMRTFDA